ncbi:MAG: response regulator [Casimicrobiaceae bacterium]
MAAVRGRILVVENDRSSQEAMCAVLRELGHVPIAVGAGKLALHMLETESDIDLVITDVAMPEMDGIDFANHASHVRPEIPVLFIAGNAAAVESLLANGAVALMKPCAPDRLKSVIDEFLEEGAG